MDQREQSSKDRCALVELDGRAADSRSPIPKVLGLGACALTGIELASPLNSLLGLSSMVSLLMVLIALLVAARREWLAMVGVGLLLGVVSASGSGLEGAAMMSGLQLDTHRLEAGIPIAGRFEGCGPWVEGTFATQSKCWLRSVRWRGRVVATRVVVRVSVPKGAESAIRCARLRGLLRRPRSPRNHIGDVRPSAGAAGAALTFTVKSHRLVQNDSCSPLTDWWSRSSEIVRNRIQRTLGNDSIAKARAERLSVQVAQRLAKAMLMGERGQLSAKFRIGLNNWGLAHLLSVSGLHVALLLGTGLAVLQVLLCRRNLARWLSLAAWTILTGSLVLLAVGPRVSVARALLMAFLVLLAQWRRRPSGSLASFGLVLCVLVLASPHLVGGFAFRLSFAATLGVIAGAPILAASWKRVPRWVGVPLAMSVSAQLAALPWSLALHPVVPLGAPLANLVAIPAAGCTLVAGVIWVVGGSLGVGLGPFDGLLGLPATVIAWLAERDPSPWLQPTWSWSPLWGLAWGIGCFVWLSAPVRRWWLLPVLAAVLWWPATATTKLSFLDVGQGDSLLLRSSGRSLLVDGGGWRSGQVASKVLLPVLAKERIKRVDVIILSHDDYDHCQGLLELSWTIKVGELWLGPGEHRGACAKSLMDEFRGRTRILVSGEELSIGHWQVVVVSDGSGATSTNGRSLILKVKTGDFSVLLTGDTDAAAERSLVSGQSGDATINERLSADWLKIAHHGSKTSSTLRFLEAVQPDVAVVSVGASNPYGHPSPTILRRLETLGVKVLRTDVLGRIDSCFDNECSGTTWEQDRHSH